MFWSKRSDETEQKAKAETPVAGGGTAVATEAGVREAIRKNVHDPEIGLNVVDLGLIYDIKVADGKVVDVVMTLTSPGCPVGPQIIGGIQTHIKRAYPDLDAINVRVTWSPLWNPDMMTQEAKDQLGFF